MSTQSLSFLFQEVGGDGISDLENEESTDHAKRQTMCLTDLAYFDISKPAPTPAVIAADKVNVSRPRTPNELESLEIIEPSHNAQAAKPNQTIWQPHMNRFRFVAAGLCSLCAGLNDSAPGALLPHIEEDYSIGYAVVSIIFVANAFGFISAAFFIDAIANRFGRSKSLMMAMLLLVCEYITIVINPPYAVIVVA